MPLRLVMVLVLVALLFVVYVWVHILNRKLIIKYALLWLIFSGSMIIAMLIPDVLKLICNLIGIRTLSNFIFFLGFGLLLWITFVLTEIVSTQKSKITSLAQEVAILKYDRKR